MHQTGHDPESAIGKMAQQMRAAYGQPAMPVIAGESSYDGLDLRESAAGCSPAMPRGRCSGSG